MKSYRERFLSAGRELWIPLLGYLCYLVIVAVLGTLWDRFTLSCALPKTSVLVINAVHFVLGSMVVLVVAVGSVSAAPRFNETKVFCWLCSLALVVLSVIKGYGLTLIDVPLPGAIVHGVGSSVVMLLPVIAVFSVVWMAGRERFR